MGIASCPTICDSSTQCAVIWGEKVWYERAEVQKWWKAVMLLVNVTEELWIGRMTQIRAFLLSLSPGVIYNLTGERDTYWWEHCSTVSAMTHLARVPWLRLSASSADTREGWTCADFFLQQPGHQAFLPWDPVAEDNLGRPAFCGISFISHTSYLLPMFAFICCPYLSFKIHGLGSQSREISKTSEF